MKANLLLLIFIVFQLNLSAQKISVGIVSGINISDINSNTNNGKWETKTGPLAGVYFEYNLSNTIAINTQINYLTLYYQYKDYYSNLPIEFLNKTNFITTRLYNYGMNYSYLRFPFMFKFQTPTRLSFNFSTGFYYAILLNRNEYRNMEVSNEDAGLVFSNGLSYNLLNIVKLDFTIQYNLGLKTVFEEAKNRDWEFAIGIGYTFKSSKNKIKYKIQTFSDTINPKFYIKYAGGANITQNFGDNKNKYNAGSGFLISASLISRTKDGLSFQTGIIYERKSYTFTDSSSINYYIKQDVYNKWIDSKTDIDYISIPALMNFSLSKKQNFYINTGLYASFRINARVVGIATGHYINENYYSKIKTHIYDNIDKEFTDMDAGWIFGMEYKTGIFSKYQLDIALQYNSSFVNIYKNAKSDNEMIKLRSLSLSVGIQIPAL